MRRKKRTLADPGIKRDFFEHIQQYEASQGKKRSLRVLAMPFIAILRHTVKKGELGHLWSASHRVSFS